MTVMNESLQKKKIREMLKNKGISPDKIDVEAYVDPNNHLYENIRDIEEKLDTTLYKNEEVDLDTLEEVEEDGNHDRAKKFIDEVARENGLKGTLSIILDREDKALNDIRREYGLNFLLSYLHKKGLSKKVILSKVREMKRTIRELLEEKPEYREILEKLVNYEERYGEGYEWDDVGVNASRLAYLRSKGILKTTYDSSNYTEYGLVNLGDVKEVLKEFEEKERKVEEKKIEQKKFKGLQITEEEKEEFRRIIEEHDPLEYWYPYVNPKLQKMEKHKKAVLLSLASLKDKYGDRGRIHILLYGDAGTGKTRLAHWVASKLGHAETSHRTTDVGLTGDARGNEITMGELPQAHGGHLIIDELDKFDKEDREGVLESMSDGKVTISAGGKKQSFKAETTIIGCANDIDKFGEALRSRFDFRIKCEHPPKEEGKEIVSGIVEGWRRSKKDYSGKKLKKYLRWIKQFEPDIPEGTRKEVKEVLREYIDKKDKDEVEVRDYERYMRIGMAIARLNRRDLKVEDVIRAIDLVNGDVLLSNSVEL